MDEGQALALIRTLDKIHADLSSLSKLKSLELEMMLSKMSDNAHTLKDFAKQLEEISTK